MKTNLYNKKEIADVLGMSERNLSRKIKLDNVPVSKGSWCIKDITIVLETYGTPEMVSDFVHSCPKLSDIVRNH
jgi:hypothetical protein